MRTNFVWVTCIRCGKRFKMDQSTYAYLKRHDLWEECLCDECLEFELKETYDEILETLKEEDELEEDLDE